MTAKATLIDGCANGSAVARLLDWLSAPDSLQAFSFVIKGLERLLPELDQVIDEDSGFQQTKPEQLSELRFALQQVTEYLGSSHQNPILSEIEPDQNRRDPFRGITGLYPLYTLIGAIGKLLPSGSELLAAALTILVGKELLTSQRFNKNYESSCDAAFDAIRRALGKPISKALPSDFVDIDAYKDSLLDLLDESPAKKKELNYLEAIERIFRFLISKTGGNRRGGTIIRDEVIEFDDLDTPKIRLQRVSSQVKDSSRLEGKRSGLAPEEFADEFEFVNLEFLATEDASTSEDPPSLAEQVAKRQNILAQLSRGAQQLPSDWGKLSDIEHALFLHSLRQICVQNIPTKSEPNNRKTLAFEACVVLASMFWAGRSLNQAVALKIYASMADLPEQLGLHSSAYVVQEQQFVTPVVRPKGNPTYKRANFEQAYPTVKHVMLPVGPYLHPIISRLPSLQRLKSSKFPDGLSSTDAFTQDADRLVSSVKQFIDNIGDVTGSRLTATRISQSLLSRIHEQTGDLALASLGASRTHRLSDTALHYLALNPIEISHRVHLATEDIANKALAELTEYVEPPVRPQTAPTVSLAIGVVGSPIYPLPETVMALASQLEKAFTSMRVSVLESDYRLSVHNAFAFYVHSMLRFATGLRDVGEPVPRWDRVDLQRGLFFISDKDDVASYSSRIVPIPSMLIEQIKCWQSYTQSLLPHLLIDKLGDAEKYERLAQGMIFYLVRTQNSIRPARSTDPKIRAQLKEFLPTFGLPWNCNRHYLRSKLSEARCPAELIDAFMGHWTRGREPWGNYSMLAPQQIFKTLRPYLEEILNKTGFRVVRGGY